MESRICTSCKVQKPLADFHRFGRDGSRIGRWCEACYQKRAERQTIKAKPHPQ